MLLDTSGLMCLLNHSEPLHQLATQLFSNIPNRVTHSYVIAEFLALATARRLVRSTAIGFVRRIQDGNSVDVVFVDESLHELGLRLLESRQDKLWSLCDAVSFILMQQRRLTEALTKDRDFEQAGFIRLLK